jgi:hypothetical protein
VREFKSIPDVLPANRRLSELDPALAAHLVLLSEQQTDPSQQDPEATEEEQYKDNPSSG